jgi:hypothetical protein
MDSAYATVPIPTDPPAVAPAADRAEAEALPQRDPGQQHKAADRDDNPADRNVQLPRDALMQHIPRIQAKSSPDQQCDAHAEAGQSQVEPGDAAKQEQFG